MPTNFWHNSNKQKGRHFVVPFYSLYICKIAQNNTRISQKIGKTTITFCKTLDKIVQVFRKKQKKRPFGCYPKGLIFYRKSSVCKPSSVLDGYLSTPIVTEGLKRVCRDAEQAFDLCSCTEWGLHARVVTKTCVGSYPAFPPLQLALRYISVALSLKSPSQDVILHSCSVVLGLSS